MRIAQVATSDISVRFLLLEHIQALSEMGHEVTAVCSPGQWVDDIRQRGIKVETVPMSRELNPLRDPRSVAELARCFRRNTFDVVHTHTPKAGLLGPLAARIARVPVIVHTIHGLLFHDAQSTARRSLYWLPEKMTATLCHHLLSQSSEDIEVCARTRICRAGKVSYLGNGIDTERFKTPMAELRRSARAALGFGDNDFVIGSVGRLVYEKGFGELFQAAEKVRAACPQVRFLVIGPEENDQSDAIPSERIRELANRGIVLFAGMRTEMSVSYAAMDAFVLPSHREGIPRACMEAAASGLPVIATNIRGCREVVVNGVTGILVPVHDPAKLADAIERLISDPAAARSMGEEGRQHICKNFDERQVLARLREFYRCLAKERLSK